MTSQSEWEETYIIGKQIMRWPSSELVSLFQKNFHLLSDSSKNERLKILELGFGTGPNIHFFETKDVDFYGIEISEVATGLAQQTFPKMRDRLICGSFTDLNQFSGGFDLIYDRASVTHSSANEINMTLKSVLGQLKKGGLYLGVEWFSKKHSDFKLPATHIDSNTRSNFMSGQFTGIGQVHFVDRAELIKIFTDFELLQLTEKVVTYQNPNQDTNQLATWNIVARKPL
jgi:SAM-dependent methyltransferase